MKQGMIAVIVFAAAFGLAGAGWIMLPGLQGDQVQAMNEADVHLERARRILNGYHHGLSLKELQLAELARSIDVSLEQPDELLDRRADDYQKEHTLRWEAYQPYDYQGSPSDTPRKARANYGNLSRQVRQGIAKREDLLAENQRILDQALREVDSALAVSVGQASGRDHPEAHRLRGVILYQQGLAKRNEARRLRREAVPLRRELSELTRVALAAKPVDEVIAASGVNEQRAALQDQAAEVESEIKDAREELTALDSKIDDFNARIEDARRRADQTRREIDELIRAESGTESGAFASRLSELDKQYRQAVREAAALEYGKLENAELAIGADLLTGSYVDAEDGSKPAQMFGLVHYQHEREVVSDRLADLEQQLKDLRNDIAALEETRATYEAQARRAAARAEEARTEAAQHYDDLNRIDAEAFAVEDEALNLFNRAQRSFSDAASAVQRWSRDTPPSVTAMDPATKQRSAWQLREQGTWMGGHVAAQEADAMLSQAWVHHQRMEAYRHEARVLASGAGLLGLAEADPAVAEEKAKAAHDDGVELITSAIDKLRRAHGDGQRHWTFVAQAATASDLMALFGHPQYVQDAIDTYESALENRDTEPYTRKLTSRLGELKSK